MINDYNSELCKAILRATFTGPAVPKQELIRRLDQSIRDKFSAIAINSAIAYLVVHGLLSVHKELTGLSNQQRVKVIQWMEVEDILDHIGDSNASNKGPVQSSS